MHVVDEARHATHASPCRDVIDTRRTQYRWKARVVPQGRRCHLTLVGLESVVTVNRQLMKWAMAAATAIRTATPIKITRAM
jgi:hypothetical protein